MFSGPGEKPANPGNVPFSTPLEPGLYCAWHADLLCGYRDLNPSPQDHATSTVKHKPPLQLLQLPVCSLCFGSFSNNTIIEIAYYGGNFPNDNARSFREHHFLSRGH